MIWEQLYPVIKEQAYYAVLRYEEPERRKDKIQELICQAYELYQRYLERGKPIRKQDFKCFITQRAKQVDMRSFAKKGLGGTSTIDVLSFYRRRPDSSTPVFCYDDWMTCNPSSKKLVEDNLAFGVDYNDWISKLNKLQKSLLDLLIQGYKATKIAVKLKTSAKNIKERINELRLSFIRYFDIPVQHKSLSFT